VSARVQFVVGDFSLHPDRSELALKRAADVSCQLSNCKHLGGVLEEVRCQLHWSGN
jgi:hypothetical protein